MVVLSKYELKVEGLILLPGPFNTEGDHSCGHPSVLKAACDGEGGRD